MTFCDAARGVLNAGQRGAVMYLLENNPKYTKVILYKGEVGRDETLLHALKKGGKLIFTSTVYVPDLYDIVYGDWGIDWNTDKTR